jgi:hypothetical protein
LVASLGRSRGGLSRVLRPPHFNQGKAR